MTNPSRVDLGDLRPLAIVDVHLASALFTVLKKTGPAFMARIIDETRRPLDARREAELERQRARALALHDALCVAVNRYRTCRGTRAQAVAAIHAFYTHCAPAGAPPLEVGRELVAMQYDPDLLAEFPNVQADAESFHAWLEEQDEDAARAIGADVAPLELEFNGALERLRQGEGKRSTVIGGAANLRERYGVLMTVRATGTA